MKEPVVPFSQPQKKLVIVGSGIFGVSTALWAMKNGGYDVTIVDKSEILPAPDAASTDLNKIIRTGDYADPVIAALNGDATKEWRKPEWEGTYHESGVLCLATSDPGTLCSGSPSSSDNGLAYVRSACRNVRSLGINAKELDTPESIREIFPSRLSESSSSSFGSNQDDSVPKLASFEGVGGYLNPAAGWAEAGRAVEVGIKRFETQLGGTIRRGCEVVGLIEEPESKGDEQSGRVVVKGIKLSNGEIIDADIVVLAAGAWTPALFAQDGMGGLNDVVATGQSVAKMQLTPEEVEEYKDIPVMFDLSTGFYAFPPNPDGIMKIAIHGAGFLNASNPPNPSSINEKASQEAGISTPRTALTPGAEDGFIPKKMVRKLREGLGRLYPKLAKEKAFDSTRLCWYLDSPNGDWLIDWHPLKQNVMLATAGSGHAFKFFPNIGREILSHIEGRLSPELASRWKFERGEEKDASKAADVRAGEERKWLKVEELASKEDLEAPMKA